MPCLACSASASSAQAPWACGDSSGTPGQYVVMRVQVQVPALVLALVLAVVQAGRWAEGGGSSRRVEGGASSRCQPKVSMAAPLLLAEAPRMVETRSCHTCHTCHPLDTTLNNTEEWMRDYCCFGFKLWIAYCTPHRHACFMASGSNLTKNTVCDTPPAVREWTVTRHGCKSGKPMSQGV